MKIYKFISLAALAGLFAFHACDISSDGVKSLTPEEKAYCLNEIQGSYRGHAYHMIIDESGIAKIDSSIVGGTPSRLDTTLSLFPLEAKLFTAGMADTTMTRAINSAEGKLSFKMYFYSTDPIAFYGDLVQVKYPFVYEGKEHEAVFSLDRLAAQCGTNAYGKYVMLLTFQPVGGTIDGATIDYESQQNPVTILMERDDQ